MRSSRQPEALQRISTLQTNGTSQGDTMKKADYKVSGGKMIRVKLDVRKRRIETIRILGDFFLHPEETINEIERALLKAPIDRDSLVVRIEAAIRKNNAVLIGAQPDDIAIAILMADGSV
ncbi:MAG: hypothetical protein DRP09_04070 [Candidatus Thorarchaeota archaeon]|nr:MAG: hypothetical protein DRP09_04070 [Candidatus Thorarchaeota archaeon]